MLWFKGAKEHRSPAAVGKGAQAAGGGRQRSIGARGRRRRPAKERRPPGTLQRSTGRRRRLAKEVRQRSIGHRSDRRRSKAKRNTGRRGGQHRKTVAGACESNGSVGITNARQTIPVTSPDCPPSNWCFAATSTGCTQCSFSSGDFSPAEGTLPPALAPLPQILAEYLVLVS